MKTASVMTGFLLLSTAAVAQQYVISTVAGGAPPPTPMAAVNVSIGPPQGVATDAAGNVYLASDNCVFKLDQSGTLTRVAGNSRADYSGDGGPATNAQLNNPGGVAVDSAGNLYIVDRGNYRIRKVSSSGVITTVVGGGTAGLGEGGPATNASLSYPKDVAVDSAGNLYICDDNLIRKVSSSGIITTVAGGGTAGLGDGGPATSAQLNTPTGVAVDSAGSLYIAESYTSRIRKVSSAGIITTVAGNGAFGYSGDGGPATNAQLWGPSGVAVDSAGSLYIADFNNNRIRKVSSAGIITTVAGNGALGDFGDGGPATNAGLNNPEGVAVDRAGNLYIANYYGIRKVSSAGIITHIITTVAGGGFGYSGDGGPATSAQLSGPHGVAVDSAGNLYIADEGNNRIRTVSTTGIITTVAGNGVRGYSGDGGPATNAQLNSPTGVAVDSAGNLYVADLYNYRIRKVSSAGIITTVAGNGTQGYSGDGGPATSAELYLPIGVAVDSSGNLYVADGLIRRVSSTGIITTVAGSNGNSVAVDGSGNLYIADTSNNQIRKVTPAGTITTVAGNGALGDSGDGGPATIASLFYPTDVAVDSVGNLYIADQGASGIRRVSSTGIITTVAGNGHPGYSGDGGPAMTAHLLPEGVAVDSAGNVYVADAGNNAIRLLQPVGPALSIASVTSAGSNLPGAISPGEIVVLYGSGLGPSQLTECHIGSDGLFDTQCAGTQVVFNSAPAPIIYTWATQVAVIVPYSVSGSTAQVTATYQGQTSAALSASVAPSAPALFTLDSTGKGQAAAINQDGSINTAATPAKVGSIILLYATGEGQTTPAGVDGKPASAPLPQPILPVTVTIGGQTVKPQYAGGAPGEVAGVMQINVQVPSGIPAGSAVPVVVQVGNASSQPGVTIAVAGN